MSRKGSGKMTRQRSGGTASRSTKSPARSYDFEDDFRSPGIDTGSARYTSPAKSPRRRAPQASRRPWYSGIVRGLSCKSRDSLDVTVPERPSPSITRKGSVDSDEESSFMNMGGSPNRSPPRKLSNLSPRIGRTKSRDNDTPNRTPNRSSSRGSMPQPQPQDLYQHYPNNSMVRMEENVGILGNSSSYYSSPLPPQRGTATRVMNGSAPPIGPHPSSFYNAGYGNNIYQQRSPNPAAHAASYYGQPYQPYGHHQQQTAMHHQQPYPMSPNPQFLAARSSSYYSPQTPPQQPPNSRQSASPYAAGLQSQGSMMYMAPPLPSHSGSNHNLLARRSPSPVYNLQSRSGSPPAGRSRSPSPSRLPSNNNMSSSNNNLAANFQSGYFANAPSNPPPPPPPRSASSNNFYSASSLPAAAVAAVAAAAENGPLAGGATPRPGGNQDEDYRVSLMIAEQELLLSEIARNRARNNGGTNATSGTNSHNSSAHNLNALGSHPSRFGNQFAAPVPTTATTLNGGSGSNGNGNNASLYRPNNAMNSSRNGSSNNLGAMAYGTNGSGAINAFRNTSNPNLGTVLGANRVPANGGGLMRPMLPPSNGLASPGPGPQVASPEATRLESPRRAREFLQFQQQRQQQYQSPPPSTRPAGSTPTSGNANVGGTNINGSAANSSSNANGNGAGGNGGTGGGENVVVPPSHRLASPAHRAPPPPSYMHQHPSSRYSDPKPAQFIARSLSQSRQLQRQAQSQLQEPVGPAEAAARVDVPVIRRATASPLPNSPPQTATPTPPPPPPPASPSQPQSPSQTQPRPAMTMASVMPHMFHRRPLPPVVVTAQPVADDSVDHSDIHGDGDDEEVMYTNTAALSRHPTSPQSPPQAPSSMGLASQSLPLGGDESVLSSGSQTPSVTSITQHNSGYGVNIPATSGSALSRRPTIAALQMGFVNPLRRARSTKTPGGPTQRGSLQAGNGSQQGSDAGGPEDSDGGGGVGESPATDDEKQRQREQIRQQLAINRATVASMRLQLNQASTD